MVYLQSRKVYLQSRKVYPQSQKVYSQSQMRFESALRDFKGASESNEETYFRYSLGFIPNSRVNSRLK